MELPKSFEIKSHLYPYSVSVEPTLESALKASEDGSRLYYLIDQNVHRLYHSSFDSLSSDRTLVVEATEDQKSYRAIEPLFCKLIELGIKKDSKLVVIGGGIIQDIGCFLVSLLSRGLKWDLIPTTLLAQSDSCIGSKSSVNIGPYKNQLGTFYPPRRVSLIFSVLKTLTQNEIHSGIGEIIKLALIEGGSHIQKTQEELSLLSAHPERAIETIGEMVIRTLHIKKKYIEIDEFDKGVRNILNYGHTFGHAYESATHYEIPHGIAVLLGMATATYISEKRGLTEKGSFSELDHWIRPFYTPFEKALQKADLEQIFAALKTDKKNTAGKIGCILTRGPGAMERMSLQLETEIAPHLSEFISTVNTKH